MTGLSPTPARDRAGHAAAAWAPLAGRVRPAAAADWRRPGRRDEHHHQRGADDDAAACRAAPAAAQVHRCGKVRHTVTLLWGWLGRDDWRTTPFVSCPVECNLIKKSATLEKISTKMGTPKFGVHPKGCVLVLRESSYKDEIP